MPPQHPETRLVHAAAEPDAATGGLSPAIDLSTTFARTPDYALPAGLLYGREGNPVRERLERALAELEGGAAAAAFASGVAAAHAAFMAQRPGDLVLMPAGGYSGIRRLATSVLGPWGLRAEFVDERAPGAYEAAIVARRPALVWIETPANPMWGITDIAAVAAAAHAAGARVLADNTVATPAGQSPLALGADVVLHATTKAIGGHSDVTGGALVAREADAWFARVREVQALAGGVPSPFDCWLVLRGLRTLAVRLERQSATAMRLAAALAAHPRVARVHYPGLASHPGHAVAARQMRRFSGLLSFEVAGTRDDALRVVGALRLIHRATSLGGVESLAEHRRTVEAADSPTPDTLIRVSCGLEHPDDLLADLGAALGG